MPKRSLRAPVLILTVSAFALAGCKDEGADVPVIFEETAPAGPVAGAPVAAAGRDERGSATVIVPARPAVAAIAASGPFGAAAADVPVAPPSGPSSSVIPLAAGYAVGSALSASPSDGPRIARPAPSPRLATSSAARPAMSTAARVTVGGFGAGRTSAASARGSFGG